VKGGHTGHGQIGNGPGPDIIPAYDAYAKVQGQWEPFSFPGLNLDYVFSDGTTGAEFLANGCQLNTPPPPKQVTADVKFLDADCDHLHRAEVIVDNVEGVEYAMVGETVPGGTVTVTAFADKGYELVGKTKWTHTFAETPTNCEKEELAYPSATIDVKCGVAVVTAMNGGPATLDAVFTVYVDGAVSDEFALKAGEERVLKYEFAEDSGDHKVVVSAGDTVDEFVTVKSDCEKPPANPDDFTDVTPPGPELPHTGAGETALIALAGLGMLVLGAGVKWLAVR